jgi:S-methylmethionine-dependent homocysteine/selenocysteine methylase
MSVSRSWYGGEQMNQSFMSLSRSQLKEIVNESVLVLDGAMGTELERRGAPTPRPLWSAAALIGHPEVVEAIHRAYIAAGADIIVANTFRTNGRTLRSAGLLERGEALNRTAIELARRAVAAACRAERSMRPCLRSG